MSNASSNTNSGYRASISGIGPSNAARTVSRPAARPAAPYRPAGRPSAPRPSVAIGRPNSSSSRPRAASGQRALRGNSVGTLRGRRMRPASAGRKRKKMVTAQPSHVLMHVPVQHAAALVSLGGVPFGVGR